MLIKIANRTNVSCCKIAITLIDAEKGKAKAQACVIACLRQLHPFRFFVLD
jgi:hypothetical protein